MGTLAFTGIIVATAVTMEFVAWFSHKYIMHGFLWSWHEDHHQPHQEGDGFFEKNDLFFLVFAIPSMLSFVGGATTSHSWLTAIGIGMVSSIRQSLFTWYITSAWSTSCKSEKRRRRKLWTIDCSC